MRKDATEFRQRFLRWKAGEQVYDKGRVIPHYRTGLDGEDDTVPSDNTRVVNPRLLTAEKIVDLPTAADLLKAKHEAEQIGPTPNISQQERDLGRKKYETQLWALLKKALELATNLMMLGIIDPRYAALGFGMGQIARAVGSAVKAGKTLYKGYKISKAIDKAVDGGIINRRVINPIKYSDVGSSYDISVLPQSAIDHYNNLGVDGLVDNTTHASFFRNFTGMSPSEFKNHWYNKLPETIPDSYKQRFIQRELDGVLKRAQETIDDIKNVRTSGLDSRLYEARDAIAELYDSPEYRKRWPAYSPRPDELIGNLRGVSGSVLNRHIVKTDDTQFIIPKGVNASGSYSPTLRRIQVLNLSEPGFFDTATHEFSHASDLGEDIEDLIYDKLVPKKSLSEKNTLYYNQRTEKRARVMSALADMRRLGYNINSYNDLLDYLLFENGFGNHNVKSLFDNYDFEIQDLLDIFAKGKSLVPPVIGVELYNKFTNDKR